MGSGLELREVQCWRGDRLLFSNLDAQVQAGQLLRVTGPNGAGKTSLLRMVCGLMAPAQGQILWQGAPTCGLRDELGRQLIYIGHTNATKDDLTPQENLAASAGLGGLRVDADAVRTALSAAGLAQQARLATRLLSQGQRRRLALARLGLGDAARLWVLDEPFNALDTAATLWLSGLLHDHASRGGITVLTSHHDIPLNPGIAQIQVAL